MTNPISDPLVGRTFGQYQILARVGGGGMGVVYTARDTRLTRIVALKFLPAQWSHDAAAKERFVREAQAASATNHPNICTIHDIESADDGQLFIVMAYYEGQTLKTRLESGPLPIEEALDVATQVADGLAKAHAQGVVHRDIKPGNLILTDDGVRILDFGLATFVDALKLTAENAPLGTVAYMSPEQVRGQQADARADVWATGAVLYEMLTGHAPFRGSHPEAISYAVRNEPPTPIRDERSEVPEEVEQLVFRALHKEPGVRFASGRELARALRQVRGLSVPLELRTQPLPALPVPAPRETPRTHWKRWAAASLVLVVLAFGVWVSWPAQRVPVALVPVVNQTGYPELDDYRLALTEELQSQLADLPDARVLPHQRLLEIIRPYREDGRDVSSREALEAVATHSRAQVLILPTLLRDDHGWRVRLEFRDPRTGVSAGTYESPSVISALAKQTAYSLIAGLSPAVSAHFVANGPRRAAIAAAFGRVFGRAARAAQPRLESLDAARLFEQGIEALEQFEYTAARKAFEASAQGDPRSALPRAWQSRAALLMRQDKEAVDAAERALRLLTEATPEADRLLVEAIAAEARRDNETAGARYQALVSRHHDEPRWLIEFGGFQDRQGMNLEGVATFHRALALDDRLLLAHLQLCRLYSPSRLNEPALARRFGESALMVSRRFGNREAEAQALWCLTDVLREGSQAERASARENADQALSIMEQLHHPFGIARGYNYAAVVALLADRDAARAVPLLRRTLDAARGVGFVLLEARTLMNLGVAYDMLGERSKALEAYRESFTMSEALRNAQDAARSLANAAAILIDYGEPQDGLRDAQNALGVFQKLGDKDFEVHSRRVIGSYYRHVGQYDEALRQLNLGLAVAQERNIGEKIARLTLELGRAHFDAGNYVKAQELLMRASSAPGVDGVQAHIELARTLSRLGDFSASRAELEIATNDIERSKDVGSLPLLNLARGELQYETDRVDAARPFLRDASTAWSDGELPEDASVEARAYSGWLTMLTGDRARGTSAINQSLGHARTTGRLAIEARCLVFLARGAILSRDFDAAVVKLGELTEQREALLSPELRAQVRYWRGEAFRGKGDGRAGAERAAARSLLDGWLANVIGVSHQSNVRLRPVIRLISEGDSVAGR